MKWFPLRSWKGKKHHMLVTFYKTPKSSQFLSRSCFFSYYRGTSTFISVQFLWYNNSDLYACLFWLCAWWCILVLDDSTVIWLVFGRMAFLFLLFRKSFVQGYIREGDKRFTMLHWCINEKKCRQFSNSLIDASWIWCSFTLLHGQSYVGTVVFVYFNIPLNYFDC